VQTDEQDKNILGEGKYGADRGDSTSRRQKERKNMSWWE
jgi:hypothetical protein